MTDARNSKTQSANSSRLKRRRDDDRDLEPDVSQRLKEIESSGEPMSLAEKISRETSPSQLSEESKANDEQAINVNQLQKMTMEELPAHALKDGLKDFEDLDKDELVSAILKQQIKRQGLMVGEGTLQILPDGFGFLRSPDYHYLSCPDDIYVSPSQIRKFNLRNGAVVRGQIRPPKENERYFALLRVESVNGHSPEDNSRLTSFDDLIFRCDFEDISRGSVFCYNQTVRIGISIDISNFYGYKIHQHILL